MLRKTLSGIALGIAVSSVPVVGSYLGGWVRYGWNWFESVTPVEVQIARAEGLIDDLAAKKADFISRENEVERGTQALQVRVQDRQAQIDGRKEQIKGVDSLLSNPQTEYVLKEADSGKAEVLTFSALKARQENWQSELAVLTRTEEEDRRQLEMDHKQSASVSEKLQGFDQKLADARLELNRLKEKALDAQISAEGNDLKQAVDGATGTGAELSHAFEMIHNGIDEINPIDVNVAGTNAPDEQFIFGPSASQSPAGQTLSAKDQ
jgi:chromosome segregation ATPase